MNKQAISALLTCTLFVATGYSQNAGSSNAPVYGVFWMKARADVDKAARIVTLNDIQITEAKFPSVPGLQNEYLALIRKHVPTVSKTVALDHLDLVSVTTSSSASIPLPASAWSGIAMLGVLATVASMFRAKGRASVP